MYENPPRFKKAEFDILQLPTRWICAACGEIITSSSGGWIEWHTYDAPTVSMNKHLYPRIVHKQRACRYPPENSVDFSIGDDSIEDFQNPKGLWRLVDRYGENLENPDPKFVLIAWRLVIHDYDFGNKLIKYRTVPTHAEVRNYERSCARAQTLGPGRRRGPRVPRSGT